MVDTFKIVSTLIDFSEGGSAPYILAAFAARTLGLACEFEDEYGPAGNWVNPQTGTPIGIDMGEFDSWLDKQAAR